MFRISAVFRLNQGLWPHACVLRSPNCYVMYLWSTYIQSIKALWKIPKFVEVGQQIGLHVLITLLLLDITQGHKWNSCMKPSYYWNEWYSRLFLANFLERYQWYWYLRGILEGICIVELFTRLLYDYIIQTVNLGHIHVGIHYTG